MSRVTGNVAPIDHGGDSCLERPEQSRQRGGVDVVRRVVAGDVEAGRRTEVANEGLPQVAVGVDEPGHDNRLGGIDDLGASSAKRCTHLADDPILDQYVCFDHVANGPIERQDRAALDQHFAHHQPVPSSTVS
jgi:hypothetical protein